MTLTLDYTPTGTLKVRTDNGDYAMTSIGSNKFTCSPIWKTQSSGYKLSGSFRIITSNTATDSDAYTLSAFSINLLTVKDNPRIFMDVRRYDPNTGKATDEGTRVISTLRFTCDGSGATRSSPAYTATLTGGGTLNATVAQMAARSVENSTSAISGTFNVGTTYTLKLTITNGYETATATYTVPAALANLHLAGYETGGVAVGRFGSSTSGNPKFEVKYKSYFDDYVSIGGNLYVGGNQIKTRKIVDMTDKEFRPITDNHLKSVVVQQTIAANSTYTYTASGGDLLLVMVTTGAPALYMVTIWSGGTAQIVPIVTNSQTAVACNNFKVTISNTRSSGNYVTIVKLNNNS